MQFIRGTVLGCALLSLAPLSAQEPVAEQIGDRVVRFWRLAEDSKRAGPSLTGDEDARRQAEQAEEKEARRLAHRRSPGGAVNSVESCGPRLPDR